MFRFALENLLSRKTRSLLALMGLTVAILAMVGLFSVAEGIDQTVTHAFGRISGIVAVQQGAPIPLFSKLPAEWEHDIAAVPGVGFVNAEIWQRANLINGEIVTSPPRLLFGTDLPNRLKMRESVYRDDIVEGRFLTLDDRKTDNTVISRSIADQYHVGVGDTLRVNHHDLHVVGIYDCGSMLLDIAIILDIQQVRAITRFDQHSVSAFYIEAEPGHDVEQVIADIDKAFADRQLPPWSPSESALAYGFPSLAVPDLIKAVWSLVDVVMSTSLQTEHSFDSAANSHAGGKGEKSESPMEIRSVIDWADRFNEFSEDLDILLLLMTSIGVMIAVLSITNTMLMSVSERIIEFGILKANGWSKGDVIRLITYESAALGLGGGVCGCVLGWLGTLFVNWKWPTHINLYASPQLLLFSLLFSTVLGIASGLYPAWWATRLTPIEAIRRG